ncbi:MAG: hypothetical protein LBH28_06450 [Oscillospiraceae bacterium]|jgi:ABC-type transporter MlaC component|nr:hypothetical protein [Oscillospiraceae bacterium]
MNKTALEQISADIHAIRQDTNYLTRVLRIAAVSSYSGSMMAAKILSAKTKGERDEAVKEANEILQTIKKSLTEEWNNG